MDGRWNLILAGGLVAGLVGCNSTPKTPPPLATAAAPASPPATPPPLRQTAAKPNTPKTVFVSESADDTAKKDGPLAAATLIVFANNYVDTVARDPGKPAAERERLLTQAREFYQQVLQREPKNVDALLGLGQMYHVSGEATKVQEIERRLKAEHPKEAKVWGWMAVRQGQAKQWDAAAESYHMAAKLDPDNRVYRTHLGFTLARAGRYEEGYAWLSKCMKESDARFNLAQMMVHNGHPDDARRELALALEVDPGYKPAQDQLATLAPDTGRMTPPNIRTVGHEFGNK